MATKDSDSQKVGPLSRAAINIPSVLTHWTLSTSSWNHCTRHSRWERLLWFSTCNSLGSQPFFPTRPPQSASECTACKNSAEDACWETLFSGPTRALCREGRTPGSIWKGQAAQTKPKLWRTSRPSVGNRAAPNRTLLGGISHNCTKTDAHGRKESLLSF